MKNTRTPKRLNQNTSPLKINHPHLKTPNRAAHEVSGKGNSPTTPTTPIAIHQQLLPIALTLQSWHIHLLVASTPHDISTIAKCAARYHLLPKQPLWTAHFDKRFCLDPQSVLNRQHYIERHNLQLSLPRNPFPTLITPYQ